MITKRYTTTPAFINPANSKAFSYSTDTMWVYILAPLMGGAFAGFWHHYNGYVINQLKEASAEENTDRKSINEQDAGLLD